MPKNKAMLFIIAFLSAIWIYSFWFLFNWINEALANEAIVDMLFYIYLVWFIGTTAGLIILGTRFGPQFFQ